MISRKKIVSLLLAGALVATPLYVHAATDFGGTVTSFGSENGKVTLSLLPSGGGAAVQTVTVTGNETAYVMEGVSNGDYILKVSKYNHGTREYAVTVDGGELTQDVALYQMGDVTLDGKINMGDISKCYAHVRSITLLTDEYAKVCADVTGDGRVNMGDTSKLYASVRNSSTGIPAIPSNPVEDNKNKPIEIVGADAIDVNLASGHLVYFKLSQVAGMKLTVEDPMAYVICNGITYEAQDGVVTIPELPSSTVSLAVGNRSAEDLLVPMTVNYELGHQLNPIEVGGFLNFDAEIAPGGLVYFSLFRLSETNLTIEDPDAYVIYDGNTYYPKDGVVTVPDLYSPDTNTGIRIAVGNRGSAKKVFAATLSYDKGHQMNPIPLSNGNLTTVCAAGNSQGVYYTLTAAKAGTLTIKLTNGADCNITITSDILEGGTRSVSLSDTEGSTSLSFKMIAGETVSVCIVMTPVNGFNYPEGTVTTSVRFR